MKSTHLSEIITQLEFAWQEIQSFHPDVPDAVITSSRRRHRSEATTRAQHCAEVWKAGDELKAEITIFGERLADGAEQVMQSLLHEGAHALAHARNIQDTSNRNRFHNKKFAALAEELGLEPPAASGGPSLGWSDCTITSATATKYKEAIDKIDKALTLYVPARQAEEKKPKKPTRKAFCTCPSEKDGEDFNSITWSKGLQKKMDEIGLPPLLCGICREPFIPDMEEEN